MELSGENPPVWIYYGGTEPDRNSFRLISISFTGYVREAIISKLETFASQFSFIPWVAPCADFLRQNTHIYLSKRRAFNRFMEARELAGHAFLMPDEVQMQWLDLLEQEPAT
ncbi:MAG: hypothetical protein AAFV07_21420, partial [Bacteroidota bacterium]